MTTSTPSLTARLFRVEFLDELRAIVREPTSLVFSIVMPIGMFVLFVSLFGKGDSEFGGPVGTQMVATFGTFGVLTVALLNPGTSVAADRNRGWLRAKQVSGVPVGVTLAAKVASALPYALGLLVAMAVASQLTGTLTAPPLRLLAVAGVLLLGALPFALLGLAIGFVASPNATAAVLNALLLPSAVFSGLWMPLDIMPEFVRDLAHFLPTYHLARLATTPLYGGEVLVHVLVLLGTTAVTATLAAVAYRRGKP